MRLPTLVLLFLASCSAALWTAATAFEAAQSTRVAYKYIASALAPQAQDHPTVSWETPVVDLVRPFTEADAVLIGRALHEAWQVHAVAQDSGDAELLADRFTGVAEERATQSVAGAVKHGGRMIVLSQNAVPLFFHKDGSLFQARVEMVVARYLSTDGTRLDAMRVDRETGVATFLNESNGWRLMSWERRTSNPVEQPEVSFDGKLVGLNYYPAETPWRDFWPAFDAANLALDFDRLVELNANSVRIFLTRDAFLGNASDAALKNLEHLLALAGEKGLQVVPTLFDLKQDYNLGTWAEDALFLKRVLPVLATSSAVAFVDLKNEPDLDFAAHGTAKVTAWLHSMIALSRDMAPGISLTVGWSSAAVADTLVSNLDVVTYHDYAPLDGTADRLAELRGRIGEKPVFVTEIGDSTFGLIIGVPGSEASQAKRISQRLKALSDADGVMVWTLYDFPNVDPSVVGGSPWVKRLQSSFGVLRADGTEKRAADALRTEFATK